MKVLIVGILVLTLGVAAVSTYLIKSFQTPEALEHLEKQKATPKKFVLVAARDLPVGHTIVDADITWQAWIDEALRPEYVVRQEGGGGPETDLSETVIGSLVRLGFVAGEPLTSGKLFKRDQPGFLAGMLTPGMRPFVIKVSANTAAAGFIFPGDRVDVALTHSQANQLIDPKTRREGPPYLAYLTETILPDKKVLVIGQQVTDFKGQAVTVPSITIEVTPKEYEILSVAGKMGALSLALRSLDQPAASEDRPEDERFTTDVEVSPFLRNLWARRKSQLEEEAEDEAEDEAEAPVAPPITVYRGQAQATEEITEEITEE